MELCRTISVCVCLCYTTRVLLLKWSLRARVAELTGCSHTLTHTHRAGFLGSFQPSSQQVKRGSLSLCQEAVRLTQETQNQTGVSEEEEDEDVHQETQRVCFLLG